MKAEIKVAGGKLLRAECEVEDGNLKNVKFTGDFFLIPEESIQSLENLLNNIPVKKNVITQKVESFFNSNKIILIGLEPKHFTQVIMQAVA